MKFWILGILALILLLWSLRESFTTYEDALKDVGQTAGYTSLTPKCPEGSSLNTEKTMCKFTDTTKADVVPTCSKDTLEFVGGVCRPKTQPVGTTTGTTAALPLENSGTTAGTSQCPSGFVEDMRLGEGTPMARLRCKKETGQPKCPDGYTMTPFVKMAEGQYNGGTCEKGGESTVARCEGDAMLNVINDKQVCVEYEFVRLGGTSTTSGPGMSQKATTTGTTTGGSSTSSFGPNSGGGGDRRKQVFGPLSNGRGDGGVVPMDSSKTSQYPELLGGGDSRPSTRIDGGGIVDPSKNWQLANDGSLPSDASLGTNENSKYLPFSRQPGDMDIIPDPYRVSQQFSTASYSFKTEPAPFLTDFSAFLR